MEARSNERNMVSPEAIRPTSLGAAVRSISLASATLTTGLVAGLFYAWAVSVNLGLAEQSDASYIATMNAVTERIENPLFFASFLGAPLLLLAALAVHLPRFRSGRFRLVALACALLIGGAFLVTMSANVPLNYELLRVSADAPAGELARERAAFEGSWVFWNWVRTVFSTLAFVALISACLMREPSGPKSSDQ